MYLVLNYRLNFDDEFDINNYYELSMHSSKNVFVDMFDCEELNKCLRDNYSLGEDIHVYCIEPETLTINQDELNEKSIYRFKIKSEVPFKILKSSSKYLNQNNFMVYRFCSSMQDLIKQNKWEQCVQGLINSLNFNSLIEVSNFLKDSPKSSKDEFIINKAIEEIEHKALLESFNIKGVDIKDIINISLKDKGSENLIISRIKSRIYSEIEDVESIFLDLKILKSIENTNILKELSLDYMNKIILIYCSASVGKKDILKKAELIVDDLIGYLESNNYEYCYIEEQYNNLIKQSKRLCF